VQTLNSLPNLGEPCIERNTVKRYRLTDMAREDESLRRQRKNLPERGMQLLGPQTSTISSSFQIGPTDALQKQRVACEQKLAIQEIARALGCVPGSVDRCQSCVAYLHDLAISNVCETTVDSPLFWQPQSGPTELRELA
jgi:hypothetical protein